MALLQWGPDVTGGRRFHIEDPNNEYQEVRRALHFDRGWTRVGKKEDCELRWTLDERAIDFDKLRDAQMVNHYRDIRCLTTKARLDQDARRGAQVDRFFRVVGVLSSVVCAG